ncbi:MAG: histidine kinase, partial [Rhodoferax sp.]|nr:histidine kinase [Rhodoferax sp.]
MTSSTPARPARNGARSGLPLPPLAMTGFAVAIVAVVLIAFFSFNSLKVRASTADRVSNTLTVIERLQGLLSSMKDAETGQRGFLLTGSERYLDPYTEAQASFAGQLQSVRDLVADNRRQVEYVKTVGEYATMKFRELDETIQLRRTGNAEGALALVRSDRGRLTMDRIRDVVGEMIRSEQQQLAVRQDEWQNAVSLSARVQGGGAALLLLLITIAAVLSSRDYRAREAQMWLRAGQAGLSLQVQGEQRLETLGTNVLAYLTDFLGSHVGGL